MDQKIRQQWSGPTRAAFRCTALIRGACDVEMCPFQPLCELAKEGRGRDGSAVTSTHIREICKVALQLVAVLVRQGHMPGPVISAHASVNQLAHQSVVIAQRAGVMMPQSHDASACQSRNVDNRR